MTNSNLRDCATQENDKAIEVCVEEMRALKFRHFHLYGDEYTEAIVKDIIEAYERVRADSAWQPIETAPKDGTPIVLYRAGWDTLPLAHWGAQDAVDEDHLDVYFYGWHLKDEFENFGGEQDGFLGWNEDIADGAMPTHWMPLPQPPTVAQRGSTLPKESENDDE